MEKLKKLMVACIVMLAFLTGFLSCYAVNSLYINKESPFLVSFASAKEQPGDWIKDEQIKVLEDRVIIYIKDAFLSNYAATGSMLPILGEYTNGIKIIPKNSEQIKIGDIITFEQDNKLIVHRVVDRGEDKEGVYFVTKGDNNETTDGKVYWENIKYVTVALIY